MNRAVSCRNASTRSWSKSGWTEGSAFTSSRFRRCSHCAAKSPTSASLRRVGEQAPHLGAQDGGLGQLAALGRVEQLVVGDAAPQEEREARGELEISQRVRLPRLGARRVLEHAQEEVGVDEQPLEGELDAGVEAAAGLRPSVAGRTRSSVSTSLSVGGRR